MAALARQQYGVVSAAQLRAAGLTEAAVRRRVASGRLHRIHRGVYAVGHSGLTRRARQLAAVLACGPDAVLSHRSAGELWGIAREGSSVEITAPRSRGPRCDMTVHRSRQLAHAERSVIDAIPVTSLARTLLDLADVLDEGRLAKAVHEAEVRRLFDLDAVLRSLDRVPGRAGRHRLRRVLSDYGDGPALTRSEAERMFLELCARHMLPMPSVNVPVLGFEVDFLWPDARLAVEIDGALVHQTRRAFEGDRRRDRALAASGIQVVRVTWRDLTDAPVALASEVRAILARRGRDRNQRLTALR